MPGPQTRTASSFPYIGTEWKGEARHWITKKKKCNFNVGSLDIHPNKHSSLCVCLALWPGTGGTVLGPGTGGTIPGSGPGLPGGGKKHNLTG